MWWFLVYDPLIILDLSPNVQIAKELRLILARKLGFYMIVNAS
jgi:hypothetical protein